MICRDCARYDAENAKCLDGKVNPERWDAAFNVAKVVGVRAICVLNDHRERLIGCLTRNERPNPRSRN